jgi:bifunctional non-homologous end joining protein LigD
VRAAALAVRDVLAELALPSFVKTSGSKGFHILIPLDGETDYPAVWRFAHGVGAVLVKRHAATFTQEFIKADRAGRILVDTGRNGPGATFAAVYAVRPKPGAPVSAPCSWQEIERDGVGPRTFTLRTMPERIRDAQAQVHDPWADLHAKRCSLREPLAALERLLTEADWNEAMAATTRRPTSRKAKPKR